MRSSSARDSLMVMIFAKVMSNVTCPGPSMMFRPASPKEVPLGFTHVVPEAGVLEPEVSGEQNAVVLNHSRVVEGPRKTGAPVTLARSEPLTPRLISTELPRTRGVKYS